jgi:hypothetical protein
MLAVPILGDPRGNGAEDNIYKLPKAQPKIDCKATQLKQRVTRALTTRKKKKLPMLTREPIDEIRYVLVYHDV